MTSNIIHENNSVHIFGIEGITRCTQEENEMLFNKDFNVEDFISSLESFEYEQEPDMLLEKILDHVKRNKKAYIKLTFCIASTLFMVANPTSCFAYTASDNILRNVAESVGSDIFDGVSMGTIKGTLVITALRLFAEYTRGGSKYKAFEVLKQCVVVLSVIIILPLLPGLVTLVVKKYLPY